MAFIRITVPQKASKIFVQTICLLVIPQVKNASSEHAEEFSHSGEKSPNQGGRESTKTAPIETQ